MQTPKTLGERISLTMKEQGLNQTQLAERLGVVPSYISKAIKGELMPTADKLIQISEILRTTTDYLLGIVSDGIPFYSDYFNGQELRITLNLGLSPTTHFAIYSKWNTLSSINKDDLLIFKHFIGISGGNIVLVNKQQRELLLGRLWDNILTFENGDKPIDISDNKTYKVVGRLEKTIRSFK